MAEERRDYGILVTYAMREEAEVAAAALRAEGIDALVSPGFHATYDWHLVQALGGLKVFVPWQKLEEARDVIRGRMRDAAEDRAVDPGEGRLQRRDRYKVWLVIAASFGMYGYAYWLNSGEAGEFVYQAPTLPPGFFFAAPQHLKAADQTAVLLDYCKDFPWDRVRAPGVGSGEIVECADILAQD
jgi:hypothetical protein